MELKVTMQNLTYGFNLGKFEDPAGMLSLDQDIVGAVCEDEACKATLASWENGTIDRMVDE